MSSKSRNRNNLSLPSVPKNKAQTSLDECLGKNTCTHLGTPVNSISSSASDLEDFGIKISGLSSSSSLSWSEDYESEISKKVQSELEKLDRLFQDSGENVSSYDIDEIAEWKQHFPYLSVLGHGTPTNSAENSDASSDSDDLTPQMSLECKQRMTTKNITSIANKKQRHSQDILNPIRYYNSLPRKPRSLDTDKYLQVSSINSSEIRQRNVYPHRAFIKQKSKGDEYISLPFINATPSKSKYHQKNYLTTLHLPPIESTFRSISATPRQVSSKNMYIPLNYERTSYKKSRNLKSDLMTLFDNIPISHR